MNQVPGVDAVKLQEGFNTFYAPREAGDMDMVAEAVEGFKHYEMDDKIQIFLDHPTIKEAQTRRPAVQRFLLNRYWFNQIITVPFDTMEVRRSLITDGPEEDWMRLFAQNVLPFAKTNNLPSS